MCNTFTKYFIDKAKKLHKEGLHLKKVGLPAQAYAKFLERDLLIERSKG